MWLSGILPFLDDHSIPKDKSWREFYALVITILPYTIATVISPHYYNFSKKVIISDLKFHLGWSFSLVPFPFILFYSGILISRAPRQNITIEWNTPLNSEKLLTA